MAVLQNIILWITVVNTITSVHTLRVPQFPQNTEMLNSPDATKMTETSVIDTDSTSSQENDISYQDKSIQRRRIRTSNPVPPVEPKDDPNALRIPESCKHSTYCEEVINYPEEAVSNLISTLGEGISLQIDKLDEPDFTQRVALDGNVELCDAEESLVRPRAGLGYDSKQHFLVNGKDDKDKVQGFRVQNCLKSDCKCNGVVLGYQNGYRGRCKQFYVYRTATAFKMINSTNAEQYQIQIKLPGYCACIAETCTETRWRCAKCANKNMLFLENSIFLLAS